MVGFIFGGTTGLTYDQLQRRRQIEQDFAARLLGEKPKTALEGVAALVGGIGNGIRSWQTEKALKAGTDEAKTAGWDAIQKAIMTGQPIDLGSSPSPSSPAPAANLPMPGAANEMSAVSPDNDPVQDSLNAGKPSGNGYISYANQGATRSQPINDKLAGALNFLPELGVSMQVFSGGQDAAGEGSARTGSTRHDHGNAADVFFMKDGRKLDWNNEQDRPIFEEIVRRGKAAGITGFGAGPGYMQPGSMHLGYGTPAVWGAGGKSANAPDWLRTAYGNPGPVQVASLNGAPAAQPQTAAQAINVQAPQQPRSTAPAPAANTAPQVAQSGPFGNEIDANLWKSYTNGYLPPEMRQAVGMLLQQRMLAAQAAQEEQRWRSRQDYETQQKRADPSYQLEQDYRRAQIDALHGKKEKNWQKLDDATLFDPETGETRHVGAHGGDGGFRYGGNSVEAQSLNGLMDSGTLTPAQAQQIGAGKTITGPNGEIIFLTPQGVFSQSPQGGQPMPMNPPGAGQPSAPPAAVPNGSTAPGAPSSSGMPSPADGATAAPTQPGMIPLTGPKPQNKQIPAEMGARIGMGDAFLKELPNIRQQIQNGDASGPIDGAMLGLGIGTPAAIWRNIETGRDALVRNLTGAGMSESEAKNQTARYQISPTDSQETMLSKLDNLERDLLATRDGAIKARTGNLGEAPKAEADPLASAREAIAKGAPREAIIQRLRENGINPEGL